MIKLIKTYSVLILFIFHFFGVLLFAYDPKSAELSFLTLFVCVFLILIHENNVQKYYIYLSIILIGYLIEIIGVNTNLLFGNYSYGDSLGVKIFNVPPLIGLNWLIIIISGASVSRLLFRKKSIWIVSLSSSIICTLLDIIIEPVAIKFNFWNWNNGDIPMYNYLCWLIFSFLFSYLYLRYKPHLNKIGPYTYGVWVLFFISLSFLN